MLLLLWMSAASPFHPNMQKSGCGRCVTAPIYSVPYLYKRVGTCSSAGSTNRSRCGAQFKVDDDLTATLVHIYDYEVCVCIIDATNSVSSDFKFQLHFCQLSVVSLLHMSARCKPSQNARYCLGLTHPVLS